MKAFPPTIIIRHRKENIKKCSLKGLETRSDCIFLRYPLAQLPPLEGYCLLTLGAPELSEEDRNVGLLLIDGTWKYAEQMLGRLQFPPHIKKRTLPSNLKTAYPRKNNPCGGLASVEALYSAYQILGRPIAGLLDNYYWKEDFVRGAEPVFHKISSDSEKVAQADLGIV
ncbi:MAG: hypothetical protein ACKVOH_04770 [Chlamydiales bacterium]